MLRRQGIVDRQSCLLHLSENAAERALRANTSVRLRCQQRKLGTLCRCCAMMHVAVRSTATPQATVRQQRGSKGWFQMVWAIQAEYAQKSMAISQATGKAEKLQ